MNSHQRRLNVRAEQRRWKKYERELTFGELRYVRQGSAIAVRQGDYIARLPRKRRAEIVHTLLKLGIERVRNGPAAYDEPISMADAIRMLGHPEKEAIDACLKAEGARPGEDALSVITLFLFQNPIEETKPGGHDG
jgi:hypothetical protein